MAGGDYISAISAETFTSGSMGGAARCVNISIIDDRALEDNETFTVVLTTSDPDVILGTSRTTVTITDNDGKKQTYTYCDQYHRNNLFPVQATIAKLILP